ncbi:hypothetical protein [Microbacterium sp. No. 7]|uniref:hypothetical protein n=1 Tax=Microbacterium sp. No. 7 TaxID=1714373 RepID=UPI0006D0DE32|nr:hypothetical protein [Microbacterium sp. No. 7]ALJ19583.1 hypothetical protein AOA12_06535 [Microbacterium sp. No. 7]
MSALRAFRDRNTGLVENYPEEVAKTFTFLEPYDGDVPCIDCTPETPAEGIDEQRDPDSENEE